MKKHYMRQLLLGSLALALVSETQVLAQGKSQERGSGIAKNKKSKISADLMKVAEDQAARAQRSAPVVSQVEGLSVTPDVQIFDGYVVIEATSVEGNASGLLQELQAQGLKSGASYGVMVSGLFPIAKLQGLEAVNSLLFVRPAYTPARNVGAVTSQGDVSLKSDLVRAKYNVSGAGVKVGILSDSYNNRNGAAAGVASGDLPANVQVLEDLPSGGSDEGRGMAELVHDVAPGADLAFHTAFLGQASFAQGIIRLEEAGSRMIVDDVIYFAEPFFEDGIIAQAAEEVVDRGSSYFSSAGNQGQQSYQAPYANSGIVVPGLEGTAHAFAPGDVRQSIRIPARGSLTISLQWTDPFFSANGVAGAKTDMDMYLFFGNTLIAFSAADNIANGDPVEILGVTNNGNAAATVELVITKFAGPDPKLLKYINFGSTPLAVEYDTRSSTIAGHANAEKVIAVGASAYFNTPQFNPNTPRPIINGFSSLGGTPIYFEDGVELKKPQVYEKPEVTGPDGANTTFFGADTPIDADAFPNFFGTSAAAPHVAAVGALMLGGVVGNLPPTQIRKRLIASALDMDNPLTPGVFDTGFDFKTGYGFVQADVVFEELKNRVRSESLTAVAASSIKGSGVLALGTEASVYPNPSTGEVTFNVVAEENQPISVVVSDLSGREVFRTKGTQRLSLTQNLGALPKGMYITKFEVAGRSSSQKLVIQ
ncbi:T9SS type A sorting domain-containing protein [Hymenobacter sp. BT188]|uniref:T9SS type A sorting domain-containing protein n=1 Tax=Hymenobacter sp. BT188 TaxID=2763504 RepID=UPI00165191E8|nr:T9SS type A sorting domain-containing protein [Hymenobacter sp. BT188]MBC6605230.1 T9SS type A sorting domain-containing protein [Hymenobacter sp. BT188]